MSNSLWDARVELAAAHRMAVIDGLNEGTWNHFSLLVPGQSDQMLTSPEFFHWKQVRASNLDLIAADGRLVGGGERFDASAYCIHFPIHTHCPNAACVLHAHTPYTIAIGLGGNGGLEMVEQNALGFYGQVAYYDYDGSVFSTEHGKRLADRLGNRRVLFLRGHGVVVVGSSVAEAYTDLYQLERACAVQCHALAMGIKLKPVSADIAEGVVEGDYPSRYKKAHFAAMRRLLDQEQPDYAS